MKQTTWTPIDIASATIVEICPGSVRIAHPLLPRPRWFAPSRSGYLYSRYTGRAIDGYASGYVLLRSGTPITMTEVQGVQS